MQYHQQQKQPGCGGCLLIIILLLLVPGGASLLGGIFSFLLSAFAVVVALFLGFGIWVRYKIANYEKSQTESHNRFVSLLVHILIHIAKLDGEISKSEIQVIQRFFQVHLRYNQTQMHWVKELIKQASNSTQSLESLLQEFKNSFAHEPRLLLMELIYQLLFSQGEPSKEKLQKAKEIAQFLGFSEYQQRAFEAKHRHGGGQQYNYGGGSSFSSSDESRYYAILELEKGVDFASIKKAYRKLSLQYHPDKVSHLGEEFQKVAEEKMKEINAAYDYFKKRQNI